MYPSETKCRNFKKIIAGWACGKISPQILKPATIVRCFSTQKKTPQIPNATVHLDIHGPFVSYGDNKFVITLTDEAT